MSCATTQLLALPFCGPREKSHGVRGLIKHYNLLLDPKLGHGKFEIRKRPCAGISYTTMLDMIWAYEFDPNIHLRYQPVVDCTYWPVLGFLNKFNTIKFNNKNIK